MALSAAERQRRCREKRKNNPAKVEEVKRKDLERYHARKKLVKDMNPREHLQKRRQWNIRNKKRREKIRALNVIATDTPPSSPSLSRSTTPRERGRRLVRRDRSKLQRENVRLKEQIEELNKKVRKYKKRLSRNKKRNENLQKEKEVSKYAVLSNAVKDHYKKIKSYKERRVFQKIFTGQRVSKSRTKNQLLQESLGISKLSKHRSVLPKSTALQQRIKNFYLRDDVSRATAGKRETVTLHKNKEQKRILLDSMKNLHKAFLKENQGIKCHYSVFTKHRPFYVVPATVDGRDTCTCKVHANMAFTAITLHKNKVIDTYDMNQIIIRIVCNVDSIACMNGTCSDCKTKQLNYDLSNNEKTVDLVQWVRNTEIIEKNGKKYKVTKHGKGEEKMTIEGLIQKFEEQLKSFKNHVFNIKSQYKAYRQCINNLTQTDIALHIDFSENYACKYHTEIQAHHFGGSRNQVTLHTVVMYAQSPEDGQKIVTSFCTVSPNNNHGPAAIWAHLDPIFKYIETELPLVKTVHFFSDGPATQYKQKINFYLIGTRFFERYRFEGVTWNFFESGHGKGAADGLGGCLKRMADNIVATGHDIPDASVFFEALKDRTKIKLFFVDDDDIIRVADTIPSGIIPLKGTMQVHQMFSQQPGTLSHRVLSCFCQNFCSCYNIKTYRPLPESVTTTAIPLSEPEIASGNSQPEPETTTVYPPSPCLSDTTYVGDEDPLIETTTANPPSRCLSDPTYFGDDDPLIDITNFNKAYRQRIFDSVYSPCPSSEDENEPLKIANDDNNIIPSTSNDNQKISANELHPYSIKEGTHLLVKVVSERKTEYTYLGVAKSNVDEEGDVRIMFFRHVGTSGKLFKLVESDVSDVMFENLVKILPTPKQIKRGKRVLYEFKEPIDVFEM